MIKLNMNKTFVKQPWHIFLIWNLVVLVASLGMVVYEHNYYWILLLWLVGWPE